MFDRYCVSALRIESGNASDERFFVWEIDLPNDDLGPRAIPPWVSEGQARARLAELGLLKSAINARIAWARQWMQTRILPPGHNPAEWRPSSSSRNPKTMDEVLLMVKRGVKRGRYGDES